MERVKFSVFMLSLISAPSFANSFIDDSQVKLTTRNFYLDRSFTEHNDVIPGAKDWAQGFILNFNSGYTPGTVGFGLDVQTLTSVKLQGDAKYLPSGLLPSDPQSREREKTASEIGATAKIKYKQTELKAGTLQPWTPVIFSSPSRLLPQTFLGGMLQSKDIKNLELVGGYISQVNHRDSTNYEDLSNIGSNQRFKVAKTDQFAFAGGKYNLSPNTQVGLYYAMADDIYNQAAFTFKNDHKLNNDIKLISDIRLWNSQENGSAKAGKIDNTLATANFGLDYNNHRVTFSTMQNYGDTAHPYLSGGEVLIFIDGWSTDFLNAKEQVYGLRYDYDFKDYVPGLKFMTRYTKGREIKLAYSNDKHTEDSLDFDLGYTVQSGTFKGLGLRARYAIYDNDFGAKASFKPADETRINIDYTWTFK